MFVRILFLMQWSLFLLSCSPVMSANVLYSSSDFNQKTLDTSVENFVGLQDPTLRRLFESVSCDDFEGHIWSHIHTTLFDQSPPPPPELVQKKVKSYAQNYLLNTGTSPKTVRMFAHHFSNIYKLSLEFFADKPIDIIQQELALIELIEDSESSQHENEELKNFIRQVNIIFKDIKTLIAPLDLECQVIAPQSVTMQIPQTLAIIDPSEIHPLVYGARKVMATAYQSCKVLNIPLVPSNIPDVQGIVEVSEHGIGDGIRRNISSVPLVNSSHYYLRYLQNSPPPYEGCPNPLKSPLIFDFGGKPYATSNPYPQINLFRNHGSGTSALGMDCSGFALAALAGAGLRIKRNKPMRPSYIDGVNSWMLKDPVGSGLNCLQKITATDRYALLTGDIISAKGHVVIIDRMTSDPFGLSKITSPEDCQSISQSLKSEDEDARKSTLKKFQFSIIQSTSEYNGMGINRIHIRDTVHEELTSGLIQYASNICYRKLGMSPKFTNINDITISRHTLDSQCMEKEWYFVGEECIRDCSD